MTKDTMIAALVENYVAKEITRESKIAAELRARTMRVPYRQMMAPPDTAALLGLIVRMIGAKRAVEIGTFTGYGSLAIASALPRDGKLICLDISDERPAIGRPYWKRAGVSERIELRIAPALETLKALLKAGAGKFDFAFIDADKSNNDRYYELCLKLVRPGGVIAIDNTLRRGAVADRRVKDPEIEAIRGLNAKIRDDKRVDACLLTVGDGVMVARKR
jgi:caffeoyl-CoA O-methyltransferase